MCAYLDVNVNLVTMQLRRGEDVLKGKEYIFWSDFFFFKNFTYPLVGLAMHLIAALTVVPYLAASVVMI